MFGYDLPHWPGHTIALSLIVGWIANLLPGAATLASFIYFCLMIYEGVTVQRWLAQWRLHRHTIRLAKLQARQALAEAEIAALKIDQPSV